MVYLRSRKAILRVQCHHAGTRLPATPHGPGAPLQPGAPQRRHGLGAQRKDLLLQRNYVLEVSNLTKLIQMYLFFAADRELLQV